jgi:hypothetical protein
MASPSGRIAPQFKRLFHGDACTDDGRRLVEPAPKKKTPPNTIRINIGGGLPATASGTSRMTSSHHTTDHRPSNLWINARIFVLAEHQNILDEAVYSLSGLDAEFHSKPVLVIDGLTEADLAPLHIAVPNIDVSLAALGQLFTEDDYSFDALEAAIECLGSHLSSERLVVGHISFRNEATLQMLEKAFAQRPDVFAYGLDRMN